MSSLRVSIRQHVSHTARVVVACTLMWASVVEVALAAPKGPKAAPPPTGLGGAYLFGFAAGVLWFAVSLAIELKKDHEENG